MQVPKMRQAAYEVIEIADGRKEETYRRVNRFLTRNKHPTYIGRSTMASAGQNGGLFIFRRGIEDVAIAIINPRLGVLQVLNVAKEFRSKGVGDAVLKFLKPNFVRAIESAVAWFERRGYKPLGKWKQGRRYRTRVMVRENLITLVGRIWKVFGNGTNSHQKKGKAKSAKW
jgi:GNAT superfamily N-acetyltransferase